MLTKEWRGGGGVLFALDWRQVFFGDGLLFALSSRSMAVSLRAAVFHALLLGVAVGAGGVGRRPGCLDQPHGLCSRGAFRQRQLPRRAAATSPGRRASELSADGAIGGGAIGGGAAHGLGPRHLEAVEAPVAKRVPHEVKFGKVDGENKGDNPMDPPKVWTDDLYWMRDDERKSEDVLSHLRAENAHTASVMGPTEDAQKALYAELRSHIKVRERHFSERHFLGSFLVYPS